MGSVELIGWIAVVAGALFPFSWIPAAVVAGSDEKRRLDAEEAAKGGDQDRDLSRTAPGAGEPGLASSPRPCSSRANAGAHASVVEYEAIAALDEYARWAIGPRRAGGVYRGGFGGQYYRVAAVLTGSAARVEIPWSDFAIVEIDLDGLMPGRRRVHCTPWENRPVAAEVVITLPLEGDPYLADPCSPVV
jgi:hypothetical protein